MKKNISQINSEKNSFEVIIDSSFLKVKKEKIAIDLGYREMQIPEFFGDIIDQILGIYSGLCHIRAGYTILDLQLTPACDHGLLIGNKFFNLQKTITCQLKRAEKAALFACTIGSEMEKFAARLFAQNDPVKGHIVDTVASAAVEYTTEILHDYIAKQMAKQELSITNRFSPGYCNWPVSEQNLLFSFFPPEFCGISVTESALMIPRKSTSGIIGIGSSVKREPYMCDRCNRKDCTYRNYLLYRENRIIQKSTQN